MYPQNMTFLCLLIMKRNLNLIAITAALFLIGVPEESYAFQNYQAALVGSGLLSGDKTGEAEAPLIVKSERKLLSELKPLTMPKLKQFPTLPPAPEATVQVDPSPKRSPLVDQPGARLPDAGMPANYRVPPVIKASSRRLGQATPPFIKAGARRLNQANGVATIPPVVQPNPSVPPGQAVAYYPQGSSTRSPLPPIESSAVPLPLPLDTNGPTFSQGSGSRTFPESSPQSGVVQSPNRGASPEFFSAGPSIAEQPVFDDGGSGTRSGGSGTRSEGSGTRSEGSGTYSEGSGTYSEGSGTYSEGPDAGFPTGPAIEDFGTFGLVSASRCYLHAEALVFTRADGDITGPTIGSLNDFDFGGGLRLLFGRKSDSIAGSELGVFLLSGVEEDLTITNSPFLAEDFQQQSKESELYSFELNRTNFGWDVVKTFAGFKFIRFDDSYRILSTDASFPPNNSFTSLDAVNNLFGAHLGGELFYDIGYRWSGSVKGSWGVYANFNDFDSTNGLGDGPLFSNESNQATISTAAELNFSAHYQIRTDLRFQIGYNVIFVGNVATVADNLVQQVPTLNAIDVTDSDDVLFHGLSLGLEFYR